MGKFFTFRTGLSMNYGTLHRGENHQIHPRHYHIRDRVTRDLRIFFSSSRSRLGQRIEECGKNKYLIRLDESHKNFKCVYYQCNKTPYYKRLSDN